MPGQRGVGTRKANDLSRKNALDFREPSLRFVADWLVLERCIGHGMN